MLFFQKARQQHVLVVRGWETTKKDDRQDGVQPCMWYICWWMVFSLACGTSAGGWCSALHVVHLLVDGGLLRIVPAHTHHIHVQISWGTGILTTFLKITKA
jgi:hypothetical protein